MVLSSRRRAVCAAAAVTLLAGCAPAVVAAAAARAHPAPTPAGPARPGWGAVLVRGADWAGAWAQRGSLDVHSNGDGNQDRLSQFGMAYECVELATRWAAVRYGEPQLWPVSSAVQMWDAGPNLPVPMVQLDNGGALAPQFGDIVVFGATRANRTGHVAVVAATGPGFVDVVEQNWDPGRGRARLAIAGTTMAPRNGLPVLGWLRSSTEMSGVWLLGGDGGVFPLGASRGYGSLGGRRLAQPVVGIASTPSGRGYWLVAGDGGVFPFGDARGYGSAAPLRLRHPVVGIAATPTGRGYWLAAADGRVLGFGDARAFPGRAGSLRRPVIGIAADPAGAGYWLVTAGGEVAAAGAARWYGSTGRQRLSSTIVGLAPTRSGRGYWLAAADASVHPFGDAPALPPAWAMRSPVTGVVADPHGPGYWLVSADGGVQSVGGAAPIRGLSGLRLNAPILGAVPF